MFCVGAHVCQRARAKSCLTLSVPPCTCACAAQRIIREYTENSKLVRQEKRRRSVGEASQSVAKHRKQFRRFPKLLRRFSDACGRTPTLLRRFSDASPTLADELRRLNQSSSQRRKPENLGTLNQSSSQRRTNLKVRKTQNTSSQRPGTIKSLQVRLKKHKKSINFHVQPIKPHSKASQNV